LCEAVLCVTFATLFCTFFDRFVRYALMFNLAEYLQHLGYSQTSAALMASVFDFAGIFGSIVRSRQMGHPTMSTEYAWCALLDATYNVV